MNPEPEVLSLPTEAVTERPGASSPNPLPLFHRGNGKIARLPKTIRDQINNWILDGVSYPDIIGRLGEQGKDLTPGHLCEYKKRGYEDWLRQREWFEHVTTNSEFSQDLLAAPDTNALHEAGLRMAAAQMIDQLMRLGAPGSEKAQADPEQFARLVNALSRLTREALSFQKYRDACAQARAAIQEFKDPKRELTDSERQAIVSKVDQILGLAGPEPPGAWKLQVRLGNNSENADSKPSTSPLDPSTLNLPSPPQPCGLTPQPLNIQPGLSRKTSPAETKPHESHTP